MTFNEKLDKFTFLIPIFNLNAERLKNFEFILSHIKDITDNILVVEQVQNKRRRSDAHKIAKLNNVNYISVKIDDTSIHKSKLINVGTEKIKTEFVWVNDCDCYLKFRKVIEQLDFRHNFIQPFNISKYISKEETEKIFNGESVNIEFCYSDLSKSGQHTVPGTLFYVSMYGALSFIYRKNDFLEIGGMNENYTGWGLEDNSICMRVLKSSNTRFDIINIPGIHLYHERQTYREKLQHKLTRRNIETYESEFSGACADLHREMREMYQFLHKQKVAIIGIERSGTNLLSHTLSKLLSLTLYSEAFNAYNVIQNRPDYVQDVADFNLYQDFFLSKQSMLIKHLDSLNTTRDASIYFNFPSADNYRQKIKADIIRECETIIILTRYNFLDWATSFINAFKNKEWYGVEYSDTTHNIDRNMFNNLYDQWYNYHTTYISETINLCNQHNKKYKIIDYNELLFGEDDLRDININVSLKDILCNAHYHRQKKHENSYYIKNYNEVVEWFSSKSKFDKIYILTRFSLKFNNYNNHTNQKWLDERMVLFNECFRSIARQTYKNYSWLIMVDPDTPQYIIEKLLKYKQKLPQIEIIHISVNNGVYNVRSVSAKIKEYIANQRYKHNIITLWHDSDDVLVNDNTLFYFAFQFSKLPVNSVIGNSIVQKDLFKSLDDIHIAGQNYKPTKQYRLPNVSSTCLALKSDINSMSTIFDQCHTKWYKEPGITAHELRPIIPQHIKYISNTSVTNFIDDLNSLVETGKYDTDKHTTHSYIKHYYNDRFRYKLIVKNVLEIGVLRGGSVKLWHDYFVTANIYGIDKQIRPAAKFKSDRLFLLESDIHDLHKNIDNLPKNFDIIIDDASHLLDDQIKTFQLLFPHLNKGGLYIIEDIQDIDRNANLYLDLHSNVKIHDFRHIKNRYDDVVVEIIK